MEDLLNTQLKKVLVDNWEREVRMNQRTLFELAREIHKFGWYDKQIWDMIVQAVVTKKAVNNIYDFMEFHEIIHQINTGETNPLRGNYTADIETYLKKHYTEDRQWKYDAERRELRPVQDLIDQRERAVITNYKQDKPPVDE